MNDICKDAAVYLAMNGVRSPSHSDWQNAINLISARKQKQLTAKELGELVMQVEFDFEDGIDDAWLVKVLPPPPTSEEIMKESKDAKTKRTSRNKQVR